MTTPTNIIVETPGRAYPRCGALIVLDADRIVSAVFAAIAQLSERIAGLERRLP